MLSLLNGFQFLMAFLLLTLMLLGLGLSASAQELLTDPTVGNPAHQRVVPRAPSSAQQPKVLKGGVQTLEAAIETEAGLVDWYAWYMACRQYIIRTGGFSCREGTEIRFHRNGRLEAISRDQHCLWSVQNKRFPLPQNTQLEAVILPTRSPTAPAASPQEILWRTKRPRF